ncbi:ABC transporter ATP-binding protein [Alcaligenaceae bacterium]|nr:ABC transporter ATP-binding protein [Alcaligenaceae bacterium]
MILDAKDPFLTPPSGIEPGHPFIQIKGLEKSYRSQDGGSIRALGPITLDIRKNEFLTIVGPSGCGKSTLLKLLAGLISRSSGSIHIAGQEIFGPQLDIGVVFQAPVLLPWRTAIENVMLPAHVNKLDPRKSKARGLELLSMVGLGDFHAKYPNELSGGMQQRVAIARALMHDPSTLLMDEPFGALDAMTRESMNVEIRRLWANAGKTVIFVTHSIPEAVFLGTRVLVLSSRPGKIAEIVDVELDEDRSLDIVASDVFGTYTRRIRRHFNSNGAIE